MKTDVEIAQSAQMQDIRRIAEKLNISEDELELYGKYKAKISLETWQRIKDRPNGKLGHPFRSVPPRWRCLPAYASERQILPDR